MLSHDQIWSAIDRLAQRAGLTASALAKQAGLDATTFNKSKRITSQGHARWPSTESIAKILAATNTNVDEFIALIPRDQSASPPNLPFRMADEGLATAFDKQGLPAGAGWDSLPIPGAEGQGAFALALTRGAHGSVYHDGDVVIVSAAAARRKGDCILVIHPDGRVEIGLLAQETASSIHLKAESGADMPVIKRNAVRLIARILWLAQ
jgi:phage repressor protein C with HTH and peptisase S24 domain